MSNPNESWSIVLDGESVGRADVREPRFMSEGRVRGDEVEGLISLPIADFRRGFDPAYNAYADECRDLSNWPDKTPIEAARYPPADELWQQVGLLLAFIADEFDDSTFGFVGRGDDEAPWVLLELDEARLRDDHIELAVTARRTVHAAR